MFIDRVRISVIAGKGGDGCIAFRREKHVPRGGPFGGDGGKGGDVIIRVDPMMTTLIDFYYISNYKGKNGIAGGGALKTGANGEPYIISVPPGTTVLDAETGEVLADLVEGEFIAAKGGKGGRGNASFKSSSNRAPHYATEGKPGEERLLVLELKLVADIGLVGAPNAGKSTFLSKVSSAHPKIADYPFTTLEPNLGIVELSGERRIVISDVPGIIEGAHIGKGLGLEFLRHVERNILLFLFIDLSGDTKSDLDMILSEIEKYAEGRLKDKPYIIVGTKADVALQENVKIIKSRGGHIISSITGKGVKELLEKAYSIVESYRTQMEEIDV